MAFASYTDIATRLQESALSALGQAAATQLCSEATAIICDAVDLSEDTIDDICGADAIVVLKGVTVSMVCRTMASPQGLLSAEETLGAKTRRESYRREPGMVLSAAEERICRQAVYGSLTGSSNPRGLPDRLIDLIDNKDVDEEPVAY